MKIWISAYSVNALGEAVPAPIACYVDTSESVLCDLGKGLRAYSLIAPPPLPPTTVVVEATTGAILLGDLATIRQGVAKSKSFSLEALERFQENQRVIRDDALLCTSEEFWPFIAKVWSLIPK